MQVAAAEFQDPGRRGGQRDRDARGVHGARYEIGGAVGTQRDLLPGGVPGGGVAPLRQGPEGARARPGDHQALGGELGERPGDGHRAHPEPLNQRPARRELSTWRVAVEFPPQLFCQFTHAATLLHENTE